MTLAVDISNYTVNFNAEALAEAGLAVQLLHLGLPDHFIDHGDPMRLLAQLGLDAEGIQRSIEHRLS